jgi:hypothetical protein
VQKNFEKNAAAANRSRSVEPTHIRKLCAAAVLGLALFAVATPAHADDAPPGADASAAAIAAAADTASAAAAAQASAVAGDVATPAAPPAPEAPQSGSTSEPSGGISATTAPEPTQSGPPTIDGAAAAAVEGATAAATAVVAAAKQVVSLPQIAAAGSGSPPAPDTAPPAGTTNTGGQYQQSGGRYQPGNSVPISSGIKGIASSEPSSEPPSVSSPKSSGIPAPKCPQDLPDSAIQKACDDALSQLPDVRTMLGAPAPDHSSAQPHPRRTHRTRTVPQPASPASAVAPQPQTESVPHHAPVVVAVPIAKHTAPAATPHTRPAAGRTHRVQPTTGRRNVEPSLATTLRPDTPVRDAAGSERTDAPARPSLFLVAVVLGLASLVVALGSLGLRRGDALTAITTRVRSKGLSSRAKPRMRAREDAPPAIRYRE